MYSNLLDNRTPWTDDEKALLIVMVALHERAWSRISAEFNAMTAWSLKMKYKDMQVEGLVEGNQEEENNSEEDQED